MRWIADIPGWRFEIERDEAVGFYLHVFEGTRCVRDHLQDTLDAAMVQASEDYGVKRATWRQISN